MIPQQLIAVGLVAILTACSAEGEDSVPTLMTTYPVESEHSHVTLYRNSPLSTDLRVHWATFNSADGLTYNLENCEMSARILNANIVASARDSGKEPWLGVGFWCETGAYSEKGEIPPAFDAEFPSDTRSSLRFSE